MRPGPDRPAESGERPALRALVSREDEILALRASGLTLAEIGRRFGVSRQRISRIIDSSELGRIPQTEVLAARREADARRARSHADEILALWRHGASLAEIQRRAAISARSVRQTVAELATEADGQARLDVRRARLAARSLLRFYDQDLCDGLRLVARKLGHTPTSLDYSRLSDELGLAAFPTVYSRFGGWRPALRAAGFDVPSDSVRRRRWDITACWRAVVSVRDELGDPPSYRRYERLAASRDDLPSGATVRLRLGLWPGIVAALREHAQAAGQALPGLDDAAYADRERPGDRGAVA